MYVSQCRLCGLVIQGPESNSKDPTTKRTEDVIANGAEALKHLIEAHQPNGVQALNSANLYGLFLALLYFNTDEHLKAQLVAFRPGLSNAVLFVDYSDVEKQLCVPKPAPPDAAPPGDGSMVN